jgi:hypothetical protein
VSVAAAHSYEQRGLARDAFREEPLPSGAKVDPDLRHGLHYSRTDTLTGLCTHGNKTVSMPFGLFAAHREDLGHAPEPAAECNIW